MKKSELENRIRELELELSNLKSGVIATSHANRKTIEAEKAKLESEEKFSTIFNMSQSLICVADINTATFKFINPAFKKVLGYNENELLSKPFLEFVHPDDKESTISIIEKDLKKGKPKIYFVNRYKCKDGHYRHLAWNSFPLPKKGITYAIAHDITEQKKIEQELITAKEKAEENEIKLKQSDRVFNLTLDMFCIAGFDGYFKYLNPAWERTLGWSIEELLSKPWLDFVHPDDVENTENIKSVIVDGKEIYQFENRYISKDGSIKWFSWNSQPFPKENIMIGAVRDITEQKRIENELIKNERILNETGRLAKIGGWELDVVTMTSYYTQETMRIYGISLDAEVPNGIEGIKHYPEEASRKLQKLIQDAIENGTPYDVELPFINKQGKHLWVRTIGFPEKKDGKVTRLYGTLQDITERKHADKLLQSSQEMLLSSQSVANICSYSTNLNLTEINKSYWECSPEFYKIFGIDETYPHTIEGWIGFLHPEYREDVAAYHESVVLEKKSFNREYKIIRINDGVERWVQGTGELVYDEKGNPIRMYGAIQDITERKQVELALKESEQYLEKAQTVAQTGHYIWDLGKSILTWSNEMFNIYGLKQENGTPTPEEFLNYVHEDDKYKLSPENMEMIIQKPYHELQYKIIDQSTNDVKHIYLWGETIFNNTGEPIRVIGVVQDITKQKNTEFELIRAKEKAEESEKKLLEAQKLSHIGNWEYIIDSDTIIWSEELFNIFERAHDLPAPIYSEQSSHYTEESFALLDKSVRDSIQNDKPYEIELDIITSSGGVKQIISKGAVKKDKHNVTIGLYGTAQDITKQKKIEKELIRAKEKAEQSDRLKSAFLTNMSHEIRTPMNGILGFSELLKKPNISNEEQKRFISIIGQSGKRMLNTINDIIDISKIESGLVSVNIQKANINEKLEFAYKFFKPLAEKKDIKLSFKNGLPDKESRIKTDNEKIYGILTNLVNNAIKFTEGGSIEFGYEKQGEYLEFYVKDTGIGIPKDRRDAIFERFIQADIEDKQAFQGSGLGLAISKSFVEMLGGKMWVESQEGLGSDFYFTIPYNVASEADIKIKKIVSPEPKDSEIKNLKTLIVEDDEISYSLLTQTLDEISGEVLHAITGVEAVEICRKTPDLDLVLMDIRMPEMNGLEATSKIRQFNKDLVIIAQTAYGFVSDCKMALEAGCNDYISKPINMTQLNELIKKHVKK